MARCDACFSILTKNDQNCYVCGEPVKGAPKRPWRFLMGSWTKPVSPSKPVSPANGIDQSQVGQKRDWS